MVLPIHLKNRVEGYWCLFTNNRVKVTPNVRWGDNRTFEFAFDRLEANGIYAVST